MCINNNLIYINVNSAMTVVMTSLLFQRSVDDRPEDMAKEMHHGSAATRRRKQRPENPNMVMFRL